MQEASRVQGVTAEKTQPTVGAQRPPVRFANQASVLSQCSKNTSDASSLHLQLAQGQIQLLMAADSLLRETNEAMINPYQHITIAEHQSPLRMQLDEDF